VTEAYLLFGLRVLSALLLLAFLGLIAWLAYQDIRAAGALGYQNQQVYGYLRVVKSENGDPVPDTLFPLLPVTTIGRAPGSVVTLDDSYVSNEHAILTLRANQWWLEDLQSRNGTELNDIPLTDGVVLSPGDIIAIGGTELKVEPVLSAPTNTAQQDKNGNDVG